MSETPEGRFVADEYFVTGGTLSLTELENMENWKYQAWLAVRVAMAQKQHNDEFKARNSK